MDLSLSLDMPTDGSSRERDWIELPREKLLERGPGALSDAELLAVILRTGRRGCTAINLAIELLDNKDGLAGLLSDDQSDLLEAPGMGPAKVAVLLAALELGKRCAEQPLTQRSVMNSPGETRRFLQHHLGTRSREVFCCLFLDAQHRLLRCTDLFMGTIDGAAVYPREVVAQALRYRATAVIVAHNHPSGVVQPSTADKRLTARLREALALVDLGLLDHLIVGRGNCYSFAENGLL